MCVIGCMSTDRTPKDAVEVDSVAFSKGNIPEHVNPVIVQIPDADLEPPKVETDDTTVVVANGNKNHDPNYGSGFNRALWRDHDAKGAAADRRSDFHKSKMACGFVGGSS